MFGVAWRASLRQKIIAWSFIPTTIIMIVVALISYYAYQRVTEKLVIERDRDLTRLSANLLAAEFAARMDPLSEQFMLVFDSGMIVFDERDKILASEPETMEDWGSDWAKRIPLRSMLGSSEPIYSDVLATGFGGEKVVVVFVPIIDRGGEYIGGIASVFRVRPAPNSEFYNRIERLNRANEGSIFLVDGNGRAIYHSEPDLIGQDLSGHEVVQEVLDGGVGALRTRDADGDAIVASYAPVPGTSWGLVTEESWRHLTEVSRTFSQLLLFLMALGVAVPLMIVNFGVRRIVRPVSDLTVAAQQIAGGDFDQRIVAETGDEIEDLAEQFNLMANRLQESYDHLEHEVRDRTKELAALNNLAAVVSRSLDLTETMNDALDQAMDIIGVDKGQAFVLDDSTQRLVLVAHRNLSEQVVEYTQQLPLGVSTAGLAASLGQPVCREVSEYPEGVLKELLQDERIELVISAPLLAREKTVGAIDLGARTSRQVSEEEISLLVAIGHQIGVAVENARLYGQAQRLAVVQERNRLARDLHDSVTQSLYGVNLYSEAAGRQLALGNVSLTADHLQEIQDTAQEALREMRLLIFELRSPILEREGLANALQSRLEAVEERSGLGVAFTMEGAGVIDPEVEEALYRVAQEALNNALKHACADCVTVCLRQDGERVILEIADDGTGFEPSMAQHKGGMGLKSMAERVARLGGDLSVESSPGHGTRITVEVHS